MSTYDRPPIILVDMDGVQADLEAGFWERWACYQPRLPQREDIQHTSFAIADRFGGKYKSQVADILNEPGFFSSLLPIPGASEAMNAMVEAGWDVVVVTAPLLTNPTCASDKFTWQKTINGAGWPARTVIARDKSLVRGDLLIDDKPHIRTSLTPVWKHVVFDATYNQDAPSPYRMHGWDSWQETLTPLLGRTVLA